MTLAASDVAQILGIPDQAHATALTIADSIQAGMPISSLERLSRLIAPGDANFVYRFVPKATLARRKAAKAKRLNNAEGNRVARIAKVFVFATEVFGDEGKTRRFLHKPHPMLDGKTALDVALATEPGADVVINILGRAAYGIAA